MELDEAFATLEIDPPADMKEVKNAKRRLLQVLHPDKHPASQEPIFRRLTEKVIEASERIMETVVEEDTRKNIDEESAGASEGEDVGGNYDDDAYAEELRELAKHTKSLVVYRDKSAGDGEITIGVRAVDYLYDWVPTMSSPGWSDIEEATAVHLIIRNETDEPVRHFDIESMSHLVDDLKHQYSPVHNSFFWLDRKGNFQQHNNFVAPDSQLEIVQPQVCKSSPA